MARRTFLHRAGAGTVVAALGGLYVVVGDDWIGAAAAAPRPDGRPRVPPGQRVIAKLKPMGGEEGDPSPSRWRLRVHGAVEAPFELDFAGLLGMAQATFAADVHCVTGWTVLGALWTGVRLRDLALRAKVRSAARHVIFEAAHGYTANVPIADALGEASAVVHRLDERPLSRDNGAPVRSLVPDLYFWKSAKWLTGVRFSERDAPGYWERRGYHNRGDPWQEERYG
jgi:DMSO/TMAO reductase YedYZ molybdopterin-dependent catalytic subunit